MVEVVIVETGELKDGYCDAKIAGHAPIGYVCDLSSAVPGKVSSVADGRLLTYFVPKHIMRHRPARPDDWPDNVISLPIGDSGTWGWFDVSGDEPKRTYPSWVRERSVREILFWDEGLEPQQPTIRNKGLAADLKTHFVNGGRIVHKVMVDTLAREMKCKKWQARQTLVEMWQQGLLRRYGIRYGIGGRLYNQEWEIA